MKKGINLFLLIIFLIFVSARIVSASFSLYKNFGGRIITTKALPIIALEAAGYSCVTFGSSVSVLPIGSPSGTPTNYFIPFYVLSKTRTTLAPHQWILGKYSGTQTTITCIYKGTPTHTQTINLDTVTLFGTSRF